jgi:hypothetical protein
LKYWRAFQILITPDQRGTSSDSFHGSLASAWSHNALDPRLFTNNSSELAGALTLPVSTSNENVLPATTTEPATPSTTNAQTSPTLSRGSGSGSPTADVQSLDPHTRPSSSLPPRFCSVKGCKATIPGDYFFKMCEPCRDRYRVYGTTKRAKWKNERVLANASLENLREKEDKRRLEAGLPVSAY